MIRTVLQGKLHRVKVTQADLNYEGSCAIDQDFLEAAGILEHEQVDVLDITNGNRLTTYAIKSKTPNSGEITINGAAAHLVKKGDLVIICAFCQLKKSAATKHRPKVVLVDAKNRMVAIEHASRPGAIAAPQVRVKKASPKRTATTSTKKGAKK